MSSLAHPVHLAAPGRRTQPPRARRHLLRGLVVVGSAYVAAVLLFWAAAQVSSLAPATDGLGEPPRAHWEATPSAGPPLRRAPPPTR